MNGKIGVVTGVTSAFGYAANHLSVFLLTLSLHASLRKAPNPGVLIVRSNLQKAGYVNDYQSLVQPKYQWVRIYAQTKLRNLIFARALSVFWRDDGITVNSFRLGVIDTGLMSGWENGAMKAVMSVVQKFFPSPEKGAVTSIFLASDPAVSNVTGALFARGRQRPHNQVADDVAI